MLRECVSRATSEITQNTRRKKRILGGTATHPSFLGHGSSCWSGRRIPTGSEWDEILDAAISPLHDKWEDAVQTPNGNPPDLLQTMSSELLAPLFYSRSAAPADPGGGAAVAKAPPPAPDPTGRQYKLALPPTANFYRVQNKQNRRQTKRFDTFMTKNAKISRLRRSNLTLSPIFVEVRTLWWHK